jgi:parallel beta-helix repeat protein
VQSIKLAGSSNNAITGNIITDNRWYSIRSDNSSDSNIIHHNNFINNNQNVFDEGKNIWDNGYPSGGNFWDDYTGSDTFSGPGQNIPGSDGIGDIPYSVPVGNRDNYPLMHPRSPYVCGDASGDGVINSADVVYLINYVYANGPAPPLLPIGDANSDGVVDIDDVVYLIRYLFTGGPAPTC